MTAEFERRPILLRHREPSAVTAAPETIGLHAEWLAPADVPKDCAIVFMHPTGMLQRMQLPTALAEIGHHVICVATRYIKNDATLIMEKVLMDLGATLRHIKQWMGFEKIVLVGWSGGASVMAFYQSQATLPDVAQTSAGARYDLTAAKLPKADGLIHVAGHASRARYLLEALDPSITDETDLTRRDPSLWLYGEDAPKPPFEPAFIEQYRVAQRARMARITQRAKLALRRGHDHAFVVQGTVADPRWLDPTVDPNERAAGYGLGDPAVLNDAPHGMGRFSHPSSWLSQWSIEDSNADAIRHLARIDVPYLMVENAADDACPRQHVLDAVAAAPEGDSTHRIVPGANHFCGGAESALSTAATFICDWLSQRSLG